MPASISSFAVVFFEEKVIGAQSYQEGTAQQADHVLIFYQCSQEIAKRFAVKTQSRSLSQTPEIK